MTWYIRRALPLVCLLNRCQLLPTVCSAAGDAHLAGTVVSHFVAVELLCTGCSSIVWLVTVAYGFDFIVVTACTLSSRWPVRLCDFESFGNVDLPSSQVFASFTCCSSNVFWHNFGELHGLNALTASDFVLRRMPRPMLLSTLRFKGPINVYVEKV